MCELTLYTCVYPFLPSCLHTPPAQVRWVQFRHCWVTAADDDTIRLWSPEGHKLQQFTYTGGSVQCIYVDNTNKLLVAAMLNRAAFVYDLDDPMPLAR